MEGKKQDALPLPESKEKLLQQLDSLDYAERINYAARLGRDHKVIASIIVRALNLIE